MPGKVVAMVTVTSGMRLDRRDQTEAASDRFQQIRVLGDDCDNRSLAPQVAIRRDQPNHVGDVGGPPRNCRREAVAKADPIYTRSSSPNGNVESP